MEIKQALKNYRPLALAKVTTLHERMDGSIFGCVAKQYECANKHTDGSIKMAGLCDTCPRQKQVKNV